MASYPIDTPHQLRTILRALRQARQLTQTELGQRLGVNQKRIARIESAPHTTSIDQISRMVAAMGYRMVIEERATHKVEEPSAPYKSGERW